MRFDVADRDRVHLLRNRLTVNEIKRDGFAVLTEVASVRDDSRLARHTYGRRDRTARGCAEQGPGRCRCRPGDRFETFAATTAAVVLDVRSPTYTEGTDAGLDDDAFRMRSPRWPRFIRRGRGVRRRIIQMVRYRRGVKRRSACGKTVLSTTLLDARNSESTVYVRLPTLLVTFHP